MKRNLSRSALLGAALLCAAWNPGGVRAQDAAPANPPAIDAEKADLIRQVIDATGAPAAAAGSISAGIEKMRVESEMPEIVWQRLAARIDPKAIFELIVPIYDAHYTKAEIQVLLDFYRSPAGKKFLVEMPKANAEISSAVGQWAEEIAASLMQELLELAGSAEEPEAATRRGENSELGDVRPVLGFRHVEARAT